MQCIEPMASDDVSLAVDYKIGDLVVYRRLYLDQIHIVDALFDDGSIGITGLKKRENWLSGCVYKESIRHITKEEKKAGKRLIVPDDYQYRDINN